MKRKINNKLIGIEKAKEKMLQENSGSFLSGLSPHKCGCCDSVSRANFALAVEIQETEDSLRTMCICLLPLSK